MQDDLYKMVVVVVQILILPRALNTNFDVVGWAAGRASGL